MNAHDVKELLKSFTHSTQLLRSVEAKALLTKCITHQGTCPFAFLKFSVWQYKASLLARICKTAQ